MCCDAAKLVRLIVEFVHFVQKHCNVLWEVRPAQPHAQHGIDYFVLILSGVLLDWFCDRLYDFILFISKNN